MYLLPETVFSNRIMKLYLCTVKAKCAVEFSKSSGSMTTHTPRFLTSHGGQEALRDRQTYRRTDRQTDSVTTNPGSSMLYLSCLLSDITVYFLPN